MVTYRSMDSIPINFHLKIKTKNNNHYFNVLCHSGVTFSLCIHITELTASTIHLQEMYTFVDPSLRTKDQHYMFNYNYHMFIQLYFQLFQFLHTPSSNYFKL